MTPEQCRAARGFQRVASARNPFAGTFEDAGGRRVVVHPQSGLSDVTADANGVIIEAERIGCAGTAPLQSAPHATEYPVPKGSLRIEHPSAVAKPQLSRRGHEPAGTTGGRLIRYVRGSLLSEACCASRTSDDRTLSSRSFKASATVHASASELNIWPIGCSGLPASTTSQLVRSTDGTAK